MSKYIKLEDAISVCREKQITEGGAVTGIRYPRADEIINDLSDLPTLEGSEDAISKECLYNELTKLTAVTPTQMDTVSDFADIIKDAPSVVPSRAEGEWIKQGQGRYRRCVCSVCGHGNGRKYNDNFCSNCGAKMKGESK